MLPKERGFTLIELLIVVAIIGILAAIAYPSYQEQVRTSRRADAAAALAGLANAMERHFTRNVTYVGATVGNAAGDIYSDKSPLDGAARYYTLSINAPTATTYALQALPVNAQAGDRCGTLTLDQAGTKGMNGQQAGMTIDDCWR